MTTTTTSMLPYNQGEDIDYAGLDFDPDQPKALSMYQDYVLQRFPYILAVRFPDLYRSSSNFLSVNTIICYDRNNLNVRVQPDYYLAFGVDAWAIRRRRLYLPWEVGKPPDFVLEIASDTTARNDIGNKRRIYAQIGIPEYWRFDPTGGDLYGEQLAGEQLVEGEYRPFELTTQPDDVLKAYSPALGLYLCWDNGMLYFYDPATRSYLRDYEQEQAAREAAEAAREAAEAAQAAAEAALRAERDAREADRNRIRQLEEELRRRPSGE